MKLPFKFSLPRFGKGRRRNRAEPEDDDDPFAAGSEDGDDEEAVVSQTVILDDPDAEDEDDPDDPRYALDEAEPAAQAPDLSPDGGEALRLDDAGNDAGDEVRGGDDADDKIPDEDDFEDIPDLPDHDDDADEDAESEPGSSKKRIALIAAGLTGLLALGGGGAWMLSGGDDIETASAVSANSAGRVTLQLAPREGPLPQLGSPDGGLSPPGSMPAQSDARTPPMAAETMAMPSETMPSETMPSETMAPESVPGDGTMTPSGTEDTMAGRTAGATAAAGAAGALPAPAAAAPMSLNALAEAQEGPDAGVVVASVSPQAFTNVPSAPPATPLTPVPDPELLQESDSSRLPMIDPDGRRPWEVYARPFEPPEGRENWPRVAIVIGGLGLSQAPTEAAIRRLPGPVTLAFDPYGRDLDTWAPLAREHGHEFLIGMPLEPAGFPVVDPGPMSLMLELEPAERNRRIDRVFSRMVGYVGVLGQHGSRFMTDETNVDAILTAMKWRGLMFVDGSVTPESLGLVYAVKRNLPAAMVRVLLDAEPTAAHIDEQLARLEQAAQEDNSAIGLGQPYPRTLERVAAWAAGLEERRLLLVPVTAALDHVGN